MISKLPYCAYACKEQIYIQMARMPGITHKNFGKLLRNFCCEAVLWDGEELPVRSSYCGAAVIGQPLRGAAVEAVGKELSESCCEELLLRSCC